MNLTNQERNNLIQNRIDNAEEILIEAELLLNNKLLKGASSRIYYSLFNLAHGLALTDKFICKTHKTLQAYFNKEYIKTEIIPKEIGVVYNDAIKMRTTGDYQIAPKLNYEEVKQLLVQAKELKDIIIELLNKWSNDNEK